MRLVMKFGGKCLANERLIIEVAEYLKKCLAEQPGLGLVVVVSAMGDFTDKTLAQIQRLAPSLYKTKDQLLINREIDYATQAGEGISAAYLAITLNQIGIKARSLNAFQLGIRTAGDYQSAQIKDIDLSRLEIEFANYQALIVTGFQGIHQSAQDEIVTLGRGGSDTTAVAIAARLGCKCEFYKKANGITVCDSELLPKAKVLEFCTYGDALNLSTYGYQFLHPRCLEIARRFSVPLEFKASPGLEGGDPWATGTIIGESKQAIEETEYRFCALAVKTGLSLVIFSQVPNSPGWSEKIFAEFRDVPLFDFQQVVINHNTAVISLVLDYEALPTNIMDKIHNVNELGKQIELSGGQNLTCLTLIDPQMVYNPGYGYRIGKALATAKVNIENQYSSGNKIHTFIGDQLPEAVLALAKEFNLLQSE